MVKEGKGRRRRIIRELTKRRRHKTIGLVSKNNGSARSDTLGSGMWAIEK